jgi:hypothetical protein
MKLSHILIAALVTSSVSIQAQTNSKKVCKEKKAKTEKTVRTKKADKKAEAKAQIFSLNQISKNEEKTEWYCPACGRG